MKSINEGVDRAQDSFQQWQQQGIELRKILRDAGCFAPAPLMQLIHMALVVLLYNGAYLFLLTNPETGYRVLALLLLAFISVQAGFIAHEAGHRAISKRRWVVGLVGQFFNTLLTALCYSHFQKIHTCHHAHTNERERDIDMQSGLFSLYPQAKLSKHGWLGRFVSRYQAYLIWPLVSLQGFSLKVDSINTLRQNPKSTRIDQFVLFLHFILWFVIPMTALGPVDVVLNYLLMTWFIGPYLGVVFLVNHIGTEVIEPDDRLPRFYQQLVTTRNLGESVIDDIFFGGINNHIEHHLFPSIPSYRLRKARRIVRQYCRQQGLIYRETSWFSAITEVFTYLRNISLTPLIEEA
jgi:fatty acid desaturase